MTNDPLEPLRRLDRPHPASDELRANLGAQLRAEFTSSAAQVGEERVGDSPGSDADIQLIELGPIREERASRPTARVLVAAVAVIIALIGIGYVHEQPENTGVTTGPTEDELANASEIVAAFCTSGDGFAQTVEEYFSFDIRSRERELTFLVELEVQSQQLADVVSDVPESVRSTVEPLSQEVLLTVSEFREADEISRRGSFDEVAVEQYARTLMLLPGATECAPERLLRAIN